ncbi:MAG TPA: hypothetical protein VGO93_22380, partial [Candidatus Xenobia bacterium]
SRRVRFVEIPINFGSRVGASSLTARFRDLAWWGSRIMLFTLAFWVRWMQAGRTVRPARPTPER